MLWSMGSQRVRQLSNWTELNWKCTEYKILEWELLDFSLRKFHSLHSLKHLQVVGNSQSSALILMKHPQHTLKKMHFFTSSLSLSLSCPSVFDTGILVYLSKPGTSIIFLHFILLTPHYPQWLLEQRPIHDAPLTSLCLLTATHYPACSHRLYHRALWPSPHPCKKCVSEKDNEIISLEKIILLENTILQSHSCAYNWRKF